MTIEVTIKIDDRIHVGIARGKYDAIVLVLEAFRNAVQQMISGKS